MGATATGRKLVITIIQTPLGPRPTFPAIPDEFTTGGKNENVHWMRRRFPYLGNSDVGGSQRLHKRCSGGRYCGPFRRTSWSARSGGRLRDRPSPSQQTRKNAAQSDWPRRWAPLARRSPQCARDGVPTRLVGALNRGESLEIFASPRAVEAEHFSLDRSAASFLRRLAGDEAEGTGRPL